MFDSYDGINVSLTKEFKKPKVQEAKEEKKDSVDRSKEWLITAIVFLLINDELSAFVSNWQVKLISKVCLYLNLIFVFTNNFWSTEEKLAEDVKTKYEVPEEVEVKTQTLYNVEAAQMVRYVIYRKNILKNLEFKQVEAFDFETICFIPEF